MKTRHDVNEAGRKQLRNLLLLTASHPCGWHVSRQGGKAMQDEARLDANAGEKFTPCLSFPVHRPQTLEMENLAEKTAHIDATQSKLHTLHDRIDRIE